MAEVVNITPINPFTIELQEYSTSDNSLINSFNIDTTFNAQTDYLEYFIYDLNGNILTVTSLTCTERNVGEILSLNSGINISINCNTI